MDGAPRGKDFQHLPTRTGAGAAPRGWQGRQGQCCSVALSSRRIHGALRCFSPGAILSVGVLSLQILAPARPSVTAGGWEFGLR